MLVEIKEHLLDKFFPPTMIEKLLRKTRPEIALNRCQKTLGVGHGDIISIFSYKDPFIRDSVIEMKTNKNRHAISLYAKLLYEEIFYYLEENLICPDYKIILTYIPQHKSTYLDKGFNQTKELVYEISKLNSGFEVIECLKKIRKTIPQRETSCRKERLKNISNSFVAINTDQFKHKIVILIDDVVTTGATLKEGSRTLLASGCLKVICFTIAH